jgi:plastocyanin
MSTQTIQISKAEGASLATFNPRDVSINAGDSLQWYNSDTEPHWPAILSLPQKDWWFPEAPISSNAPSPATVSFAPPKAGESFYTLTYNCKEHPEEQGTITVFPQA